jgi:sulfoxide reductase catalytic subunit YedY
MLIRKAPVTPASEITDERIYLRRREFIRMAGRAAAVVVAGSVFPACAAESVGADADEGGPLASPQTPIPAYKPKVVTTDEKLNTFEEITSYNNFYEFGTGKNDPQRYAGRLKTSPWKVKVDGHCSKPADYDLGDLIRPSDLEERIYRLRCVEAWSMVIPWVGVQLA